MQIMTSCKLYHDTRRLKKDGTAPLKLVVNHRSRIMINLNISVRPENFISSKIVLPDARRSKMLNDVIQKRMLYIDAELQRLALLGILSGMTDVQLKNALDGNRVLKDEDSSLVVPGVDEYWRSFIDRCKTEGTKSVYRGTLVKVGEFCNLDTLKFSDINVAWLNRFDAFMSATCSVNTRSIHMRNIRAVMNAAINEEIIDQNCYPFRKFHIKNEKTAKRALTIDELRILRDYSCEPFMEYYRDIFMLIFYLCGINAVDLFRLTEIHNGRIEYRRAKTGRLYSIKVEPEAMEIIEKYRGKTHLLDVLDKYADYKNFLHRLDRNLKLIGPVSMVSSGKASGPMKKEYTGLFPKLSTYWARHTWATVAAELDIPKETIAAALGHEIGSSVTSIYIDFNQKKIDAANRKVLDYLKENQ